MFVIPKLGELKPDRDIPEWRVSEPIQVSFFAGTALAFIIPADADAPDVHAAVERVLSLGEADRLATSVPVFENYRVFLEASHFEPLDIASPARPGDVSLACCGARPREHGPRRIPERTTLTANHVSWSR